MLTACDEGKCSDSSSLLKLNDISKLELEDKRNSLVMPQLSLIATGNFKAFNMRIASLVLKGKKVVHKIRGWHKCYLGIKREDSFVSHT